jgi:uncharacterized membrane protein (DUF373 family)
MPIDYDAQIAAIIRVMTVVPVAIYIVVAFFLTIVAIMSLGITFIDIYHMINTQNYGEGIIQVVYGILLTVIIIELFETVIVYLRTKRVPVRAILIAGLTAMIRHVIILNISETKPEVLIGSAVMIAVLVGGAYLLREDIEPIRIKI